MEILLKGVNSFSVRKVWILKSSIIDKLYLSPCTWRFGSVVYSTVCPFPLLSAKLDMVFVLEVSTSF